MGADFIDLVTCLPHELLQPWPTSRYMTLLSSLHSLHKLLPKLLQEGYIVDYIYISIWDYYRGYKGGYREFRLWLT